MLRAFPASPMRTAERATTCCRPRSTCAVRPSSWPGSVGVCRRAARSRSTTSSRSGTRMHGSLDPSTSPSSSPTARTRCSSTASCSFRGDAGLPLEVACPSCTSIIDAIDGETPHLEQSIGFAVAAKAPVEQFRAHADARGWRHARLLSSAKTTYNRDYHAEASDGSQLPMATSSRDAMVRSVTSGAASSSARRRDEGQHPRHVDFMWPLWAMLDRTPEGRGSDWSPRLDYS